MNLTANRSYGSTGIQNSDPTVEMNSRKKPANAILQRRLKSMSKTARIKRMKKKKNRNVVQSRKPPLKKIAQRNPTIRKTANRYFEGVLVGSFFGAALTSVLNRLLA